MCANFGSHLDHIFDKMCQMNTRISYRLPTISSWRLCSISVPELVEDSSDGKDNDDDVSSSMYDAEMTPFP